METLEQKIARVVREHVAVVPYDPNWPMMFEQERDHLRSCLPRDLVKRIEHFGSTAVPDLAAKPIVDILVEVADLEETKSVTRMATGPITSIWSRRLSNTGRDCYSVTTSGNIRMLHGNTER